MKQTVTIRGLTLGEGSPKIILPLMGRDIPSLLAEVEQIKALPHHMAEWRVDWFEGGGDPEAALEGAGVLRAALGETPLLATFRTAGEGGAREIGREDYKVLLTRLAQSGLVDALDIELFSGEELVRVLTEACRRAGVKTVLSNHDFAKTPPREEIVARLLKMETLGGDLPKIALMPQCPEDVLTLLSATLEASRRCRQPIITMSMGPLGAVSRLAGEVFGSCATFGSPGRPSAPGQIEAGELERILATLALDRSNNQ